MKYRPSSIALCIATSALMLTACSSSIAPSPPPTLPSAELMATPPTIARPPIATDPATGARVMRGADTLPWAIDTVAVAGELRSMVLRLQGFVREAVLQQPSDRKAP